MISLYHYPYAKSIVYTLVDENLNLKSSEAVNLRTEFVDWLSKEFSVNNDRLNLNFSWFSNAFS